MHTPSRSTPPEARESRVRGAADRPPRFDVPQICRLLYQDLEYLLEWQDYLKEHLSSHERDADGALHLAHSEQVSTTLAWTTVRAERAALHLYYLIAESDLWAGSFRRLDERPETLSFRSVRGIEREGDPWDLIAAGSRQLVNYLTWGGVSGRAADLVLIVGWLHWRFVGQFVDLSRFSPNPWSPLLSTRCFEVEEDQPDRTPSDEIAALALSSAAKVLLLLATKGNSYFAHETTIQLLSAATSLVEASDGLDETTFGKTFASPESATWYFLGQRLASLNPALAETALFPEAVATYERTEVAEQVSLSSAYNRCCSLSCAGKVTEALNGLAQVLLDEAHVGQTIWATRDPDLETVRTHAQTRDRWKHTFSSVDQAVDQASRHVALWFGQSVLSPLMRDDA